MKLVGELKKQVEETKNKEEAKEVIENAGMQLTDDELDYVTGGGAAGLAGAAGKAGKTGAGGLAGKAGKAGAAGKGDRVREFLNK